MSDDPKTRVKFDENLGCTVGVIVLGLCGVAGAIMHEAIAAAAGWPGATAVLGLSALGGVAVYFLIRRAWPPSS